MVRELEHSYFVYELLEVMYMVSHQERSLFISIIIACMKLQKEMEEGPNI